MSVSEGHSSGLPKAGLGLDNPEQTAMDVPGSTREVAGLAEALRSSEVLGRTSSTLGVRGRFGQGLESGFSKTPSQHGS